MRCLGIPVDHRLPDLTGLLSSGEPAHSPRSNHIKILSEFGQSLPTPLPAHELDFGLELARPECTGGVVVVLEHPYPSQKYVHGFVQEEAKCNTLAAIQDLVREVTRGTKDSSSITILDSMPFTSANYDYSDLHKRAQETFLRALEAKRPTVVISCFKTETKIRFLQSLQHEGIGRWPPVRLMEFAESKHKFIKINAFHPSYAVNRMIFKSCFKRLLVLEFTQAFARAYGIWTEETWMEALRKQCTNMARFYREKTGTNSATLASDALEFRKTKANFIVALKKVDHFRFTACTSAWQVTSAVSASEISWKACDVALLLQEAHTKERSESHFLISRIITKLRQCLGGHGLDLVSNNTAKEEPGYKNHGPLADVASDLEMPCARAFNDISITLLRQLNLSITPRGAGDFHAVCSYAQSSVFTRYYRVDPQAQSNALLRFAEGIEDMLRRAKTSVVETPADLGLDRLRI